jgi:hypothetical protein
VSTSSIPTTWRGTFFGHVGVWSVCRVLYRLTAAARCYCAIVACPHFRGDSEGVLKNTDVQALQQNLSEEIIQGFLEAYESPVHQRLIGFRVATTTLQPRVTPEFAEPIHTLPSFYMINFCSELQ